VTLHAIAHRRRMHGAFDLGSVLVGVAGQAKSVTSLTDNSRILRTVRIVATETGNAPRVHETLNEIVALHAVLMSSPVGEMCESCFAKLVVL